MTDAKRLMAGKKGLIMGVANDRSIAWGIARALSTHGANLAFTYQNEAFAKRVVPLVRSVGSEIVVPCEVEDPASIGAAFDIVEREWGGLDFLVHAVAYSDKEELKGRYVDSTPENFTRTMAVSCFSFTTAARHAAARMDAGGALLTLSYLGAARAMPNYNVMGVAKAALEASVRYLAADLGPANIRVNAISAGPMRTLAGSAIGGARDILRWNERHAPLRRNVTLDEVGGTALYLLSDLSAAVSGEIHHVDSGQHAAGIPAPRPETGGGSQT